jgi:large subunit ribosomal protein LP2
MRYVAAYLLAQQGGNDAPSADNIKAILSRYHPYPSLFANKNSSVGIDADEEKLSLVISQLSGKNVAEVIAEGKEKLASVPSGGAAAGGAAAGGAVAEEAKEEAKASSSEESGDDDMGFGLFD